MICFLDFLFLKKFLWIRDVCNEGVKMLGCCIVVLVGMGLGMVKYLKEMEFFYFYDLFILNVCLSFFCINLC